MSVTGKAKSFHLLNSSVARPKLLKIKKIYCGSEKNLEIIRKNLGKVKGLGGAYCNLGDRKCGNVNKDLGGTGGEVFGFVDEFRLSEGDCGGFVRAYRYKILREERFEEKLHIFFRFFEKMVEFNKNFKEIFEVFRENFESLKQGVNFLEKLRDSERNCKVLDQKCKSLESELKLVRKAEQKCNKNSDKLKFNDRVLEIINKKPLMVLDTLVKSGFPVEEHLGSKKIQKSLTTVNEISESEKLAETVKSQKTIPRLSFLKVSDQIGYQDEFMSKFHEFSQSWRKQMLIAHPHLIN